MSDNIGLQSNLDFTVSSGINIILDNDLQVSYGRFIYTPELTQFKLSAILNTIQTGDNGLKENIELIHACKDDAERRLLKAKYLSYFNMGLFKNNTRSNANFICTQYILLDCDHVEDVAGLKTKLTQDANVFVAFLLPSGDGLKVIFRLDKDLYNEATYRNIYNHYWDEFKKQYGDKFKHKDKVFHMINSFQRTLYKIYQYNSTQLLKIYVLIS
jgi:hypothetical protein